MAPSLRGKSVKSSEIRDDPRKSPRKRKVPEAIEEREKDTKENKSSVSEKMPKKTRRKAVKLDETVPKRKSADTSFASVSTPGTSSSDTEKTCAFYRVKTGEDGKPVFSKSLIKYFMTVDSPEMDDLKHRRFNTSFIRETPKDRSSLKIFTEDEDNDPKWLENVPKLNFDMPDVPGSEHAKIFESMPIGGDSDEELKKLTEEQSRSGKRRKSSRCTEFKGKPLPDQSLAVDYTSLLDLEFSSYDNPDDVKETEMKENEQEATLLDAESENKNSILLSLLSAPLEGSIRRYKYNSLQPAHTYNISSTVEDEMLLDKYKDVMGDRQVNVVLTRLPIDAQLLELCAKKKLSLKSANEEKRKVSKDNLGKKVKLPKVRLSTLQKKNHGNTKP